MKIRKAQTPQHLQNTEQREFRWKCRKNSI